MTYPSPYDIERGGGGVFTTDDTSLGEDDPSHVVIDPDLFVTACAYEHVRFVGRLTLHGVLTLSIHLKEFVSSI